MSNSQAFHSTSKYENFLFKNSDFAPKRKLKVENRQNINGEPLSRYIPQKWLSNWSDSAFLFFISFQFCFKVPLFESFQISKKCQNQQTIEDRERKTGGDISNRKALTYFNVSE